MAQQTRFLDYIRQLQGPFTKICRIRFLQPDGSTAFAVDNNPRNRRSLAFLQGGSLSCSLNNGVRRTANISFDNISREYDYAFNKVWFGQQIAIDEGLILSDGSPFYLPQGVFYIETPKENFSHNTRTMEYNLIDKWAYLDGTLFGNLEGTYEVPVGSNIFEAMGSVLLFDRGNGTKVDNTTPIFTEWYNGKTQELPDGTSASLTDTPYTLRVDGDGTNYGDIMIGLSEMLVAWIGYDQTGTLRVDPSQEDILDSTKPILWEFDMEKTQLMGMTYTTKASDVYNDFIVIGEQLSNYAQPAGRATNLDPNSDTNIYTSIGRRTFRESRAGYTTDRQCIDLANWKLKRSSVLQKSVSIESSQIFHITENSLVTIRRSDKEGSPLERHLVTGFSRPLAQDGTMSIDCTSVNDFPVSTTTSWPE